jgi:hemolysin activation/secretion protein
LYYFSVRSSFFSKYLAVVFFILWIPSTWAQIEANNSLRVIQQEQQRIEALKRQQESEQRNRSDFQAPATQTQEPAPAPSTCSNVVNIRLLGVERFSIEKFDELLARYKNRCLSIGDLNELLEKINQVYFDLGYITSRAYLAPQNLQSGELQIQVIEGHIEALIRPLSSPETQTLTQAFGKIETQLLNLRDLEQGLEQINRLGSRSATMEMLPGDIAGGTKIQITDNRRQKAWQARLQASNSGQESTGETQVQLFLSIDNPLNLYDYSYLVVQSDDKEKPQERGSESVNFHWDVPVGYWGVSADVSYFRYLSTVEGAVDTFETSGTSRDQHLGINRIMHRDQDSKTRIGFGLRRKTTHNYIEDTLITTGSRTLSIADLSIDHEQYFSNGSLLLTQLRYQRGLDLWGSPDDDDLTSPDDAKAQFDKYTLAIDYEQRFQFGQQNIRYASRLFLQYSPDILFGTEALSIGSLYTVRGYKESSIFGDSGSYWRNDLSFPMQPKVNGDWLNQWIPFVAFDAGMVRDPNPLTSKYEKLSGWAMGFNAVGNHWSVSLTYSNPINPPSYLQNKADQFEISFNLTF